MFKEEEAKHELSYSEPSQNRHVVTCSICGYWNKEEHTYEDGKCVNCGQKLPDGPVHTHSNVIFEDANGVQPNSCEVQWGSFGIVGDVWERGTINSEFTVEELIELCKKGGVIFHYTFGGDGVVDWNYDGPTVVVNVSVDDSYDAWEHGVVVTYINNGDGKYDAYVSLDRVLDSCGIVPDDIVNVCVQTWTTNFKLYKAEFLVPYNDFAYRDNKDGSHTVVCEESGEDIFIEEHTDDNTMHFDETTHWHECELCGGRINEVEHDNLYYVNDEANNSHYQTCGTCGYKSEASAHTYDGWKKADENTHKRTCVCGDEEVENHVGGTATCVTKAVCTSCNEEYGEFAPDNHTNVSEEWSSDETYHWHECNDCKAHVGEVAHVWGDGKITTEPTHTKDGVKTYTCECGRTKSEPVSATGHTWGAWTVETAPTESEAGTAKRVCTANDGGEETMPLPVLTDDSFWTKTVTKATCESDGKIVYVANGYPEITLEFKVEKTGHDYEAVFTFSEDGKTATVTLTCKNDSAHVITVKATVTSEVTTPATCEEKGVTTYTASYEHDGKSYSDTKKVTDVPAIGHAYEAVFTFSEDGKTATVILTCKNDSAHVITDKATVTSEVTTPATCEEKGVTTYTASYEHDGKSYSDTKEVIDVPAIGHLYQGVIIDFNIYYHNVRCSVCGNIIYYDLHQYGDDGICSVCGFYNPDEVKQKDGGVVTVVTPGEGTNQNGDNEGNQLQSDGIPAENPKDNGSNPSTGVIPAVLPLIIAAAAIVFSKSK